MDRQLTLIHAWCVLFTYLLMDMMVVANLSGKSDNPVKSSSSQVLYQAAVVSFIRVKALVC